MAQHFALLFAPGGATFVRVPVRTLPPNVAPDSFSVPRRDEGGFEELCHLVTDEDPDTALCGKDVTDFPWNPPWPLCEACVAIADGRQS